MRYANLAGADYLAYARLRRPAGDAAELDLIPSYQRTACRHRWGPDARD